MDEVRFHDNLLYLGKTIVSFEKKIMEIINDGDRIFVLLSFPMNQETSYDDCHNLYCYDYKGNRQWQVGERTKGSDTVFTMIRIFDSVLYATDFFGRRYSVDKDSGELMAMQIVK